MDFGSTTCDLLFNEEFDITKKEKQALSSLLKNATEDFAICSVLSGLWIPDDDDESSWIRNIKIRLSLISVCP